MKIRLVVSDKNMEVLKFRKGLTITEVIRDYSRERGKCHLTLTCQTPLSEIDSLKADLAKVKERLEKARQANDNDAVGILQLSCRKVELEGKLEKLLDGEG